jgi:hypothetical protein
VNTLHPGGTGWDGLCSDRSATGTCSKQYQSSGLTRIRFQNPHRHASSLAPVLDFEFSED